ncbi:MAG: hypothetical protein ACLRMJ_03655 [Alistipes finegoldii]
MPLPPQRHRLPYGSGELAGVIVHERFLQYETSIRRTIWPTASSAPTRSATCPSPTSASPKTARRALGDADRIQLRQGKAAAADGYAYWYPTWAPTDASRRPPQVSIPQRRLQCGLLALRLVRHGAARSVPQPHRQRRLFGFGVILEDGTNYAVKSTAVIPTAKAPTKPTGWRG